MRVSIFVLAYKMQSTIVEAIQGALAQTVPCEIIISDDASPNDIGYELAVRCVANYSGPHKVIVRRNTNNQGLCAHIDTLAKMASGDIFVFMAADDVSHPNRVRQLLDTFIHHGDAYAVGSAVDEIDSEGRPLRWNVWGLRSPMDQRQFLRCGKFVTLLGASMAIRRELLIGLPALQGMVEDNMLSLRATLFGRVYCLRESLLLYRRHESSLGSWIYLRGGDQKLARRRRYERTIIMYREIAADHERCVAAQPHLSPGVQKTAGQIISMYRIEADAREAMLISTKVHWILHIARGLMHPGLRRKSLERALKFFLPRSLIGLEQKK